MKRNMKSWVAEVIADPKVRTIPVITYPGAELIGKKIIDIVRSGELQKDCIVSLAERYPTAASVSLMDLSVEAEAFGSPVNFGENDAPTVRARIVEDEDTVAALAVPAVGAGRTQAYLDSTRLASEVVTDRPVFGGMIGPYSLAGRLYDMTEIMVSAITEPEVIHALLEKTTTFLTEYARAIRDTGANGVLIAEPAAGLLSPEQCHSFSSVYVKRIVDAVQSDEFAVILHNCGKTVNLVPSMLSTGAMGYHFGNAIDMADILPQIPEGIIACGNIDPAGTLKNGTPDEVKEKTLNLLEKMKNYPNFVLSSGCDVPPGTPLSNMDLYFSTLAEFNAGR